MTGFRLMQNLHAYSGGTVRDFHPVFYSPATLLPQPQALKRNIYLYIEYHCDDELSIENRLLSAGMPTQIGYPWLLPRPKNMPNMFS